MKSFPCSTTPRRRWPQLACTLALAAVLPALRAQTTVDNALTPTLGAFDTTGNNLTLSGTATGTASGVISGTGSLTQSGSGTWTLAAANTLTGPTTVSAGTLSFTGSGGLPNSAVTVNSGATVATSGSDSPFNSASYDLAGLSGSGAVSIGSYTNITVGSNNASTTFSGNLTGNGSSSITKTGTGTFTFTGTATNSVSLTALQGSLVFTPSSAADFLGTVSAANGGSVTVALSDPSKFKGALSTQPGGALTLDLPNSTPLAAYTVYLTGGSLTLTGHDSTALSQTTLDLHGTTVNLPGSSLTLGGLSSSGTNTFVFNNQYGGLDLTVGGNNSNSYFYDTFSPQNTASSNFGFPSNSVHVTKVGTGTLALGGAVNFQTIVQAGYAEIYSGGGENNSFGLNGGGLRYGSPMTYTGYIYVMAGGGMIDTGSNDVTMAGYFDGGSGVSAPLTKIGSGTLTLTGSNYFSGTFAINAGTLSVAASDKLGLEYPGQFSRVTLGGGTLRTTASFTSDHPMTLASGSGTVEVVSGTTLTWNGAISGTAGNSLTKTGAGTLALAAANTYAGGTTISFGTVATGHTTALGTGPVAVSAAGAILALNGTLITNTISVTNGGTLSGSGGVGTLSVSSGGTISPGNSPGLTTASTATFGPAGSYVWEINDAASPATSAGTRYDLLSISGSLTITATSGSPFAINLTSLLADHSAGAVINFNSSVNSSYTIATASGGIVDFSSDKFSLNTTGFSNALNGGTWSLAQSGNDLNLTFTASAIPEPSTYAALFGLLTLAIAVIHKRRSK